MIDILFVFLAYLFCFIGVYYLICLTWQVIEYRKYGEIRAKTKDTIICTIVSFVITILLIRGVM